MVDEAAREYFSANPHVTDRFSVEIQGKVQALAFAKEQQAHEQAKQIDHAVALVCDRSVLDAPAYVYSQGDKAGAEELLKRVRSWILTYSSIFLLDPNDVPYKTDNVRKEDEATRQLFHQGFIDLFEGNDIPYELLSGSINQRLQVVGNRIAEMAPYVF